MAVKEIRGGKGRHMLAKTYDDLYLAGLIRLGLSAAQSPAEEQSSD